MAGLAPRPVRACARAVLLLPLIACSSKSSPGGGVVAADMRDVERDGEGLVSTTFGEAPARKAEWTRAAMVLSLLKTVWGKAKAASPGLPAMQVKMVDDAVARLDMAIPNLNQKDAVIAANEVGLAVPELFDYFHPDAPKEIVRMDAVFRQLGIDAHFADWAGVARDLVSLTTDWNNARAAVLNRVPTCHRVGGTATVAGEIEDSLKNADLAVQDMNGAEVEKESDNGALEIDTLELLFDCAPDNAKPTEGVGAACKAATDCKGSSLVCDQAWGAGDGTGKCAPDPAHATIGTPCTSTTDCGNDPRSACNNEAGDGYPGGYCFMEPCDDINVCPPGSTCVSIGGETPGCFKSCQIDSDCRQAEGYVCNLFLTSSPDGFGPTDHACAFKCARDEDCKPPLKCEVLSGKCRP
jgi:hypothetical protein